MKSYDWIGALNINVLKQFAPRSGTSKALPLTLLAIAACTAVVLLGIGLKSWKTESGRREAIEAIRGANADIINADFALEVIITDSSDLAVVLPQLSQLSDLWAAKITDANFNDRELKYFRQNAELALLEISNANITGTGFSELKNTEKFTTLVIRNCPISVDGAERIASLPSLERLVVVKSDLSVDHLDAMHSLSARAVNFSRCNIDMHALERLLEAGNIQKLILVGTNLSMMEIEQIRESAPAVMIWADDNESGANVDLNTRSAFQYQRASI